MDANTYKTELLERLNIAYHHKYFACPEGEKEGGYEKRMMNGEGFINAIEIIKKFNP